MKLKTYALLPLFVVRLGLTLMHTLVRMTAARRPLLLVSFVFITVGAANILFHTRIPLVNPLSSETLETTLPQYSIPLDLSSLEAELEHYEHILNIQQTHRDALINQGLLEKKDSARQKELLQTAHTIDPNFELFTPNFCRRFSLDCN